MLIADDLDKLLEILPDFVRKPLEDHSNRKILIEVVMDLGRRPEARFPSGPEYLSSKMISWQDLDYSIKKIGNFSGDNRSGIERTLHRISSIRNREGSIVGLTCRVGRAIFGTISIIRDLLEKGSSLLLLGRPGVGKTTAIREIARVLADEMEKRVVIIDTSNEIAGDGDIPHPAIGRARRMQVARPELQHQVMIEAIENHMPEVIIIDEIGTELEALAARTIAERGVQLVGTAHGNYLESLIKNPILSDLVGGIQYVTLGDEEAKRRGTQKSILERKTTPAFQVAIEIHQRNSWVIHEQVDETVDQILEGSYAFVQQRSNQEDGSVLIECNQSDVASKLSNLSFSNKLKNIKSLDVERITTPNIMFKMNYDLADYSKKMLNQKIDRVTKLASNTNNILLYPYIGSLVQIKAIIDTLQLPLTLTKDLLNADVILGLRANVKQNTKLRQIAKARQINVYTIYSCTVPHITRALRKISGLKVNAINNLNLLFKNKSQIQVEALKEALFAIEKIAINKSQPIELLARSASLRKIQYDLVQSYGLRARSFGQEPNRKLRIYSQ